LGEAGDGIFDRGISEPPAAFVTELAMVDRLKSFAVIERLFLG